jgi:hypothetical protein
MRQFPNAEYFGGRILPDWGQAKRQWIDKEPLPLFDGVLVWFDCVGTREFGCFFHRHARFAPLVRYYNSAITRDNGSISKGH